MAEQRERVLTWFPWQDSCHADPSMPGLEYLEALRDGRIVSPPVFHTLDFRLVAVQKGSATYEFTPSEIHYNTIGTVHGGVTSTLLDSAMGSAVHSLQQPGFGHATLELKVNLVRPVRLGSGTLRAVGNVIHAGRTTATAEARLIDSDDKLFAHATTTCVIFPLSTGA